MSSRTSQTVVLARDRDPGALLIHHGHPHRGWRALVLHGPAVRLGADPACDLVLDGPGVAPRHLTLHRRGDRFVLHDHGSRAGTFVQNQRCRAPVAIDTPTRLGVGHHLLLVVPLAQPAQPARGPRTPRSPEIAPTSPHAAGLGAPRPTARAARSARPARVALGLLLGLAVGGAVGGAASVILARALPCPSPNAIDPVKPASTPAPPPDALAPAAPPAPHHAPAGPSRTLRAAPGDTWEDLARAFALPHDHLRAANPHLRRDLREGDRLLVPLTPPPAAAPAAALTVPGDAIPVGSVDDGRLLDGLRLPPHPLYTLRCPALAHASSVAASALLEAIAGLRQRTAYTGELVVGDLSRPGGGPFGSHLSHQSGRDVDLWLPTLRGRYQRGCPRCGTDLCRPDPADVDWLTTWHLIDALAATGAVTDVFLDRALHPHLAAAALAAGVDPDLVARRLAWPKRQGIPLVRHAAAHRHHLHVRFVCPKGNPTCAPRPRRR